MAFFYELLVRKKYFDCYDLIEINRIVSFLILFGPVVLFLKCVNLFTYQILHVVCGGPQQYSFVRK